MVNKIKSICMIYINLFIILLQGCSSFKNNGTVSISDNVVITYNNEEYIVLNEKVDADDLGEVIGSINSIVSDTIFSTLYKDKTNDSMINVSVSSYFLKAIKKEELQEEQETYQITNQSKEKANNTICELKVNPNDGTQLINYNGDIYQITNKSVDENQLDVYLTSISEYVVYDNDTKKVLSIKELTEIDWTGESLDKKRTTGVYTDVYSLKDNKDSIAVNIDETYYITKLVK